MEFLDRLTPEQRIVLSGAGLIIVFVLLFAFLSGAGRSFDAGDATLAVGDETLSAAALHQNEANASGLLKGLEQTKAATPTPTPAVVSGLSIPAVPATTPSATATATPVPTPKPAPTSIPQPTPVPTAPAPAQTQAAAATAPQEPTAAPEPTATPVVEPTATPEPSPTPTELPKADDGNSDDGADWSEVEFDAGTYWVSAQDGLTVRDVPGGDRVVTLHPDDEVRASGRGAMTTRSWAHISSPVDGWVAAEFLTKTKPGASAEPTASPVPVALDETTPSSSPTPVEPTATPSQPAGPTPTAGPGPTGTLAEQMAALRNCESGGNYSINTGNDYYGAYQFAPSTWTNLANKHYPHLADLLPHQASPADQDAMAFALYSEQGWAPWPKCARDLGLS